jgi:hypothetical protein
MSDLINMVSQALSSFDPTRNNFENLPQVTPEAKVETPAPVEKPETQDKE